MENITPCPDIGQWQWSPPVSPRVPVRLSTLVSCLDTVKSLGKLQSVRVASGVQTEQEWYEEQFSWEIVSDVIMVSQSDFRGCHVWWALRDRGDLLSRGGHFDRRSWHSDYVSWDKNQRSEGVCRFLPRLSQGSTGGSSYCDHILASSVTSWPRRWWCGLSSLRPKWSRARPRPTSRTWRSHRTNWSSQFTEFHLK